MATNKSKYNSLFKELASSKIYDYIKSFITNLYNQLNILQIDSFKAAHRDEFINLRLQCYDLINQIYNFCNKIFPSLEYALEQFNSSNSINIKILVENFISNIDLKHILDQCERLENKILLFNDRIATDEYYITNNIMPFLSTSSGVALTIVSLIGFLFTPVILEVDMALAASSSLLTNVAVPSIILLSEDLTKIIAENDFRQCKKKIIEASEYVFQMKMELVNIMQNYDHLEIRFNVQDIHDLQLIYEILMENIQDIRDICSKFLPAV